MEIFVVGIGKSAEAKIPVKQIKTVKLKTEIFVGAFEQRRVFEAIAQAKRAM